MLKNRSNQTIDGARERLEKFADQPKTINGREWRPRLEGDVMAVGPHGGQEV